MQSPRAGSFALMLVSSAHGSGGSGQERLPQHKLFCASGGADRVCGNTFLCSKGSPQSLAEGEPRSGSHLEGKQTGRRSARGMEEDRVGGPASAGGPPQGPGPLLAPYFKKDPNKQEMPRMEARNQIP